MTWPWELDLKALTYAGIALGIAVAVALTIHLALFALLTGITNHSQSKGDDEVVRRMRNPVRALMVAIAVSFVAEAQPIVASAWQQVARFVAPALLGWTAYALVQALTTAMYLRTEATADDMAVRSRRTRVSILSRVATAIILFVTVSLMLLGIPGVRSVGVTLMASAGLMGLAVGAAAQPALRSLIA
ncbi:MAG: mechanosensitive ion channel protein MscS, partial [Novosphingobium sp.]